MALSSYRKKRNFKATPEPRGKDGKAATGDSYLIQKHAARHLHYDLRLEMDGVLKSWAITKGPSLVPGEKRLAIHVEDHPLEYADFEGTIPKGEYGGGMVIVWDRGRWTPIGNAKKGYAKGHLDFEIEGEKLGGRWHLVRMAHKPREKKESWLLIKGNDDFARSEDDPDILDERPESVKTGRVVEELEGEAPGWSSKTGKIESSEKQKLELPKQRLADAGLESFVKTSGGKGLHVVAPLVPRAEWDAVKAFAKGLADGMAAVSSKRFVVTVTKSKRKGKILVDYLRNGRGATAVAPYSTRARPGAAVSVPLDWDELSPAIGPDYFTVENTPGLAALQADPWEDFWKAAVVGHQVVGFVVPDPLDSVGGNELVDVDCAGAFQPHRLELFVLDDDVASLIGLIALYFVLVGHWLAGFRVDVSAANPVPRIAVDRMEVHLLTLGGGRRQGHGTGDEGELEVTFPVGARRHSHTPDRAKETRNPVLGFLSCGKPA